jgi:anti-sigma factor RsiW
MNCADAVERLSAGLDGELPRDEAAELERHLHGCRACAGRFRTLQQVRAALGSTAPLPVPGAAFDARVLALVRDASPRAARLGPAWLATAAAVVLAVLSAAVILHDRPPVPASRTGPPVSALDAAVLTEGTNEQAPLAVDCGLPGPVVCIVDAAPALVAGTSN